MLGVSDDDEQRRIAEQFTGVDGLFVNRGHFKPVSLFSPLHYTFGLWSAIAKVRHSPNPSPSLWRTGTYVCVVCSRDGRETLKPETRRL